jgi:hypothetical protein
VDEVAVAVPPAVVESALLYTTQLHKENSCVNTSARNKALKCEKESVDLFFSLEKQITKAIDSQPIMPSKYDLSVALEFC